MNARIVTMWVNGSAWRVEKGKQACRSRLITADAGWQPGIPPGTTQSQVDHVFQQRSPSQR